MTSVSKNVHTDTLEDIINKCKNDIILAQLK